MNGLLPAIRSQSVGGTLDVIREYAIVPCFLALFLILSLTANNFLTWVNLLNNLEAGAIYGIVACALTLLLIVGEFDISVGAIFVLTGIIAAKLQPSLGVWPSLAVGVGVALGIGILNGIAVAFFRINSFVATLAMSLMVVGVGTKITNGFQLYISDPAFGVLGNSKAFGVDYFIWVFIAFALVCGFVLSRTKLGRWLYATGGNAEAARLSGISTRAVRVGAFAFSGFAAGVAGAVLISRTGTAIAGDGLATSSSRRSPQSSSVERASWAAAERFGERSSVCSSSSSSETGSTCSRSIRTTRTSSAVRSS